MVSKVIGATVLKRKTGEILNEVKFAKTRIIVTKDNEPYAIITPYSAAYISDKRDRVMEKYSGKSYGLSSEVAKIRKGLNSNLKFDARN